MEVLTSNKPNAETDDGLICCRMMQLAMPTTFTPGINDVGEVFRTTSAVLLVSPSMICTEFLGVSTIEPDDTPNMVKFTVTKRSGREFWYESGKKFSRCAE